MESNKHGYIMIIFPLQSKKQINTTHQRDFRVCLTMTIYKLKTLIFFSQLALGTAFFHNKRKRSNFALFLFLEMLPTPKLKALFSLKTLSANLKAHDSCLSFLCALFPLKKPTPSFKF